LDVFTSLSVLIKWYGIIGKLDFGKIDFLGHFKLRRVK
jgi:hypothetical protein